VAAGAARERAWIRRRDPVVSTNGTYCRATASWIAASQVTTRLAESGFRARRPSHARPACWSSSTVQSSELRFVHDGGRQSAVRPAGLQHQRGICVAFGAAGPTRHSESVGSGQGQWRAATAAAILSCRLPTGCLTEGTQSITSHEARIDSRGDSFERSGAMAGFVAVPVTRTLVRAESRQSQLSWGRETRWPFVDHGILVVEPVLASLSQFRPEHSCGEQEVRACPPVSFGCFSERSARSTSGCSFAEAGTDRQEYRPRRPALRFLPRSPLRQSVEDDAAPALRR